MKNRIFMLAVAGSLLASHAFAGLLLNVRIGPSAATTRPVDQQLSIAAVSGQPFSAKVEMNDRTFEVAGVVREIENSKYCVQIKVALFSTAGTQSVDTTIEAKPGEAIELAGLNGKPGHSIVLTLKPEK